MPRNMTSPEEGRQLIYSSLLEARPTDTRGRGSRRARLVQNPSLRKGIARDSRMRQHPEATNPKEVS